MPDPYGSPLAAALRDDALERFLRYVRLETTSARSSATTPSTPSQLELGRLLAGELGELGLDDVEQTETGYVYATLPALQAAPDAPSVGLLAHLDTSPDAPGRGVEPCVWRDYRGGEIVLPGDPRQVLSPQASPLLAERIGHDIVTSDGTTLLGADDKAGIAEIMAAVAYLCAHPEEARPRTRIGFTVDEEVGRGADGFDLAGFGADFAYTLDGALVGEIENETFSAVELTLTFRGVGVHPGTAKGVLVNPVKLAAAFVASLPPDLAPETTAGREGFVHPYAIAGNAEAVSVTLIVRDFDDAALADHEELVCRLAKEAVAHEPRARLTIARWDQYRTCAPRSTASPTSSRRRSKQPGARASSRGSDRSVAAPTARDSPSSAFPHRISSRAATSFTRCASGSACRTWRSRPR